MPDLDTETLYYHPTTEKLEWRCKYCPKRYSLNGGTSIMKQHLKSAHGILESSPRQERLIKRQRTIEEAITFAEKRPRKRQLIALDNSKYYTLLLLLLLLLLLD
jgi:hypothetical protein